MLGLLGSLRPVYDSRLIACIASCLLARRNALSSPIFLKNWLFGASKIENANKKFQSIWNCRFLKPFF